MSNLVYLDGELWHTEDLPDDVLMHYGVKGMKWGQRRNNKKLAKLESAYQKQSIKVDRTKNRLHKAYRRSDLERISDEMTRRQLKNKTYEGSITKKERRKLMRANISKNIDRAYRANSAVKLAGATTAIALANPKSRNFIARNGGRVVTAAYSTAKAASRATPNNFDGRVINENGRRVYRAAKKFNGNVRLVEPKAISAPMRALTR